MTSARTSPVRVDGIHRRRVVLGAATLTVLAAAGSALAAGILLAPAIVRAGGDTDTVAAIAGALAGATTGTAGIPASWVDNLIDWPHASALLRKLASALSGSDTSVSRWFSPWLFPRGLVFTAVVHMVSAGCCLPTDSGPMRPSTVDVEIGQKRLRLAPAHLGPMPPAVEEDEALNQGRYCSSVR